MQGLQAVLAKLEAEHSLSSSPSSSDADSLLARPPSKLAADFFSYAEPYSWRPGSNSPLHLAVAAGDGARLPPTHPGVCSMVTDVGIGWLGAQAFDGVALHAVSAHHMLETFTYPVRLLLPRCLASHRSEQPAV